jgi:hypothetical protein
MGFGISIEDGPLKWVHRIWVQLLIRFLMYWPCLRKIMCVHDSNWLVEFLLLELSKGEV